MSAMRSPLASGWGVLVEVDEGAVFALRFPRSQNGVVRFYETLTSRPAGSLVCTHPWWWGGCPQCGVRKVGFGWGVLVKVDDRTVLARCFPTSQNAVVSFYETPPTGRQVRWCTPIVGGVAGVRNAKFGRVRIFVGSRQSWVRAGLSAMREHTQAACRHRPSSEHAKAPAARRCLWRVLVV